jgi:GNAT superfamily N-acetyltransferase
VLFEEAVVAPRRARIVVPGMEIIERPDWVQIVTPSFTQGSLNEVSFSAMPDEDADRIIDETIARYRRRGLAFRWSVPPGSRPADLAERLARRGLIRTNVRAMARGTADFAGDRSPVEEVDASTVGEFTLTMAAGWSMDPAPILDYHRRIFAGEARPLRLFLARVDGAPAATAGTFVFERSAYLMGGVVLDRFRGRGLYRSLIAARLDDAARRGLTLATTHAREETSAPMLERMGFYTVCRFDVFRG